MPLGQFSPLFVEHMTNMATVADANGKSVLFGNTRFWNVAGISAGWSGDQLDITGMNLAFDRSGLNQQHTYALVTAGKDGGGRISDCKGLKAQVDYLAAKEREYRFRHATSIRCKIHGTVREIAHGDGSGVMYGVMKFIQNTFASGYDGSDSAAASSFDNPPGQRI